MFLKILNFEHINTFTLEPSFKGLITTGNFNFLSINLTKSDFVLSNEYKIYFGVRILFLINIFLDNSLSIAIADATTPECVYGMPVVSKIVCIYPSSPNCPCKALKIMFGLNLLISSVNLKLGSIIFTL